MTTPISKMIYYGLLQNKKLSPCNLQDTKCRKNVIRFLNRLIQINILDMILVNIFLIIQIMQKNLVLFKRLLFFVKSNNKFEEAWKNEYDENVIKILRIRELRSTI